MTHRIFSHSSPWHITLPLSTGISILALAGFSLQSAIAQTPPVQPSTPAASLPKSPERNVLVAEVVVQGVEGELRDLVLQTARIKPGGITTRSGLQTDIDAIFATGWFANVKAEPSDQASGVRVTFIVEPNPILQRVAITPPASGQTILPADVLQKAFEPQFGKRLNLKQVQTAVNTIRQWYHSNGFVLAEFLEKPRISRDGVLTLSIVEGVVESVTVAYITKDGKTTDSKGQPLRGRVSTNTILQQVKTKSGQVFNRNQMANDIKQVYDLGLFDDVQVALNPGKEPRKVVVTLKVFERANLQTNSSTNQKNDPRKTAERLQQMGDQFSLKDAKERSQAIAKYQEAQRIYQALKDPVKEAELMRTLGNYLSMEGAYADAITPYQTALRLYHVQKDARNTAIVLNNLGNTYKSLNQFPQAIATYQQALPLFQSLNAPFWRALTLTQLATIYRQLEQPDRAIEYYNQAVQQWQSIRTMPRQINANNAQSSQPKGRNQGTIAFSLVVSSKLGTWSNIDLQIGREGLDAVAFSDRRFWLATTLLSLGGTFQSVGDYQQSLLLTQQAMSDVRSALASPEWNTLLKSKDKETQALYAQVLPNVAPMLEDFFLLYLYNDLDWKDAAAQKRKQLFSRLEGVPEWLENYLLKISQKPSNQEFAELMPLVLGFTQQLLPVLLKDRQANASEQDLFYIDDTRFSAQIQALREKLPQLLQRSKVYQTIVTNPQFPKMLQLVDILIQQSLAKQHEKKGKKTEALLAYQQALNLMQNYSTPATPPAFLTQLQKAADPFKQISKNQKQTGQLPSTEQLTATTEKFTQQLINSSTVQALRTDPTNQVFDRMNQLFQFVLTQPEKKVEVHNAIGKLQLELGKPEAAIAAHQQAIAIAQTVDKPAPKAKSLFLLGNAYEAIEQQGQAIAAYQQSLAVWQKANVVLEQVDVRLALARFAQQQGNFAEARTQIETAIEQIESPEAQITYQRQQEAAQNQNNNSTSEENKPPPPPKPQPTEYTIYRDLAKYLASKQDYYAFYIDLLMQQHQKEPGKGYDQLAFLANERSRARSLRAMLRQSRQASTPPKTPAKTGFNPIELAQVPSFSNLQQLLGDRTVVLAYALGEERSYLWAVSKTSIQTYVLPKQTEIEAAFRQFNERFLAPDYRLGKKPSNSSADGVGQFSQMLLQPVASQLTDQRLIIVADGVLQYVPFAALLKPSASGNSSQPLMVDHEVVGLPAVSLLAMQPRSQKLPAQPKLAILADPIFSPQDTRLTGKPAQLSASRGQTRTTSVDAITNALYARLPGTRQEAQEILALAPAAQHLVKFDAAASRKVAMTELQPYQIVHFATHGILNSDRPERSGLIFSIMDERGLFQRSLLSTADVFNLNLSADLVVLSGCQTALGESIKGEGLIGLTGGFMYAGAERVVSSLWEVDDDATALLMGEFYERMLKQGASPAAALRAAQLELWRSPQWYAPRYWAAFILQGN